MGGGQIKNEGVCFSNIAIENVKNRQKSNKKRGPNKVQGGQIFREIPISGGVRLLGT